MTSPDFSKALPAASHFSGVTPLGRCVPATVILYLLARRQLHGKKHSARVKPGPKEQHPLNNRRLVMRVVLFAASATGTPLSDVDGIYPPTIPTYQNKNEKSTAQSEFIGYASIVMRQFLRNGDTTMKVCEKCGDDISTRDGENLCRACDEADGDTDEKVVASVKKAKRRRREKDDVMRSLGLVKVRGAMGGTYWE